MFLGYKLLVKGRSGIHVEANTFVGVLRALETLTQLVVAQPSPSGGIGLRMLRTVILC